MLVSYGSLPELGHSRHVLDVFKLLAHLDYRVSDQSRIQAHCAAQGVLCARTRIEAHDEVVAIMVRGLQFLGGFWQEKSAPVGVAAYDALLREDDIACGFGDSMGVCQSWASSR